MSTYFSPAKLNLFFRVLGKRRDGYHEIASLYTAVDLGDSLTFSAGEEDSLAIVGAPALVADSSNLVVRARDLFREKTGCRGPLKISLHKKIPLQAGLGGGSSNAATTLWAMNELHNFPLSLEALRDLASTLGSDCAFFFSKGLAYCTGRGEVVQEIEEPLDLSLHLYHPAQISLATPEVYGAFLTSDASTQDPAELLSALLKGEPCFCNDLEPAAMRLAPGLREVKTALEKSFERVVLTGSGSAFFCLHPKGEVALGTPLSMLRRPLGTWYQLRSERTVSTRG